jgi:hypothetical protein
MGLAAAPLLTSLLFTNANVNALVDYDTPIEDLPDQLYTVVGPQYFTLSNLEISEIYDSGEKYVYIEDTDVADFITSPFGGMHYEEGQPLMIMNCDWQYACIQGKKTGSTNLVVYDDNRGEVVKTIRLTSVELDPHYMSDIPAGYDFEYTGSITGADNSLLTVDSFSMVSDGVRATKTGDRSFKITSPRTIDAGLMAGVNWKIGDQIVGGGTMYNIIMIEANDEVSKDGANKNLLAFTTSSIFETIANDPWNYSEKLMNGIDLPNLKVENGSTVNVYHPGDQERWVTYMPGFPGSKYVINLSFVDKSDLTSDEEELLSSKLPSSATYVGYGAIESEVWSVSPSMNDSENILTTYVGEVVEFSDKITVTVDAGEFEKVAKNYTRKWCVAVIDRAMRSEVVDATYDEETNTITFETSKLGGFAFGYADTKNAPLVPNTGSLPVAGTVAVATFIPLMTLAGFAFIARSKKHADKKLAKEIKHFE